VGCGAQLHRRSGLRDPQSGRVHRPGSGAVHQVRGEPACLDRLPEGLPRLRAAERTRPRAARRRRGPAPRRAAAPRAAQLRGRGRGRAQRRHHRRHLRRGAHPLSPVVAGLLAPVKSKLFIASTLKSVHPLDGGYASLVRGRSFDFEDLRPYAHGDELRDIDWRATARAGEPMVKRSYAERRHTVLFVVDTGAAMRALARDENSKKQLAILAVGALATLAVRHGDDVQLMYSPAGRARRLAPRSSEGGIEQLLRAMDAAIDEATVPSARDELLNEVATTIARRMIMVV